MKRALCKSAAVWLAIKQNGKLSEETKDEIKDEEEKNVLVIRIGGTTSSGNLELLISNLKLMNFMQTFFAKSCLFDKQELVGNVFTVFFDKIKQKFHFCNKKSLTMVFGLFAK